MSSSTVGQAVCEFSITMEWKPEWKKKGLFGLFPGS